MIRKLPGKKEWGLYSKTTGRRLGTFTSIAKALKRERQIQFFKHRV
jgi:hypothetical protein